jgi:SecD/SecF fusion protein
MPKSIYTHILIVLIVLGFGFWALNPPSKTIKFGKDLAGGMSLVYQVTIGPNENPKDVIEKTIEVLKRRVDPDGLMEISMVQAGNDRIEITMPLPSERVKELKRVFDDKVASLARNKITDARVDQVMRLPQAEREKQLTELSNENPGRLKLLQEAASLFDTAQTKRTELAAATDQAAKDKLVGEVAEAEIKYDEARAKVLKTALSADDIMRVVQASRRQREIEGEGKKMELMDSPRMIAEKSLLRDHPEAADEIRSILAAYDAYAKERTTLDDPNDLARLIKGAGVLTFRITVEPSTTALDIARLRREFHELGPRNVRSTEAKWCKINQIDGWLRSKAEIDYVTKDPENVTPRFFADRGYVAEYRTGEYWILCWDTRNSRITPADGEYTVTKAGQTTDQVGRPAVSFEMSAAGGVLMNNLTGQHVNEKMAVLLDDEVYTAPNLKSQIGNRGVIEGDFPQEEINYIRRVLSAGSLTAKLSENPISTDSVGPQLGKDNLEKGYKSGVIAFIVVSAFMVVYYFSCGIIAVIALACAGFLMVAMMAAQHTSFTLPAIAGIVLTFGQAVDANVLVYERMREELKTGHDMKTATRIGFSKALPAIVDANVSHLIICFVLYNLGTQEIRGFAVALAVGVLATLFSALVFSRLIFRILVDAGHWKHATMLPMVIPALQRALEPHINWLRLRPVFITITVIWVVLSLGMSKFVGQNLLDTEFRGGTQVTLQLGADSKGHQITMTRAQAAERLKQVDKDGSDRQLKELAAGEVLPVNPQSDGVTSDKFRFRSLADQADIVLAALQNAFKDVIQTEPALTFTGSESDNLPRTAHALTANTATESVGQPIPGDTAGFKGGVAIVLENIEPPVPLDQLKQRLDRRRLSEFSETLERKREVRMLEGDEKTGVKSAVILVQDPNVTAFDNQDLFDREVMGREWKLVRSALAQAGQVADVQTFSPAVAESFKTKAIMSVVGSIFLLIIYIWFRYGAPRWALAATLPVLTDVVGMVGAVAIARWLHDNPGTNALARQALLLPFAININMVAAILTMAGFSLNDKVIILDRIRENKGKLKYASAPIVNNSINQTLSRTMITSGLILMTTLVLYFFGGEAIRGFAFVFTVGAVLGTFSSIALAAPLVWSRKVEGPPSPPTPGVPITTSRSLATTAG